MDVAMFKEEFPQVVTALIDLDIDLSTVKYSVIKKVGSELKVKDKKLYYSVMDNFDKVRRGVYNMSPLVTNINDYAKKEVPNPKMMDEVYIPEKDDTYVSWGNTRDIEKIIKSGQFYPTYITGLSGNGKTMMVEQSCAKVKKEMVRVQITPETDEDDLLGGFRLVKGETIFSKGPVIRAMESGAILLLDEIDRGTNKIMALQGVLEGKPVLLKKTGEIVKPAKGFNVIATANTKGQGSSDGRFIAANVIDESFLERFTITVEQSYPTNATEKKIVLNHMNKFDVLDDNFAEMLIVWSESIRKTYEDGGVDEQISTRRLCHIVQSYSIFKDKKKAIELSVGRFDLDTKESFLDLYSKIDVSVSESKDDLLENVLTEAAATV
jgi:MoxR-like ATPase